MRPGDPPRGDLDDRIIVHVETGVLESVYPRTVGLNSRKGPHGPGLSGTYGVVYTDQGECGWGLIDDGVIRMDATPSTPRPLGEVFSQTEGVIDSAWEGYDIPLHDLAGRVLGQPAWMMLSEDSSPRPVRPYDGAIYMDDVTVDGELRPIDLVLRNCGQDHALGYRDFKLKIGRGSKWMEPTRGLQRDIDVTREVREAFPDSRILVDANDAFSVADVITYLEALADCEPYWIEEPFREDQRSLTQLRDYLEATGRRTLIADGESQPDIPALLRLAEANLIDVLLMDIVTFGLTPWRRLLPKLASLGTMASPHTWGHPVKTFYASHLAAASALVPTIEGVPGHTVGVDDRAYDLADGHMSLPADGGFGLPLPQ